MTSSTKTGSAASFAVQSPRRFGDGWAATQLWEDLGLHTFWRDALAEDAGDVPWDKVLELFVVSRLRPRAANASSTKKWFPQTAMDVLLDTDARVADKDRLNRCLDRLLALIVTPEGFPLTYEVFPGNRLDRTTLAHILDTIETKFGKARRLWVFDRGGGSEDNLELLRQRGAHYLVGTPKSQRKAYEQKLLDGDGQNISAEVQVQLIPEADEVYGLCRSTGRVQKERAVRRRWLRRLMGDLRSLRRRVREGQLKQRELIQRVIGRLHERHSQAWRWLQWELKETDLGLDFDWDWEREKFQKRARAEGAYLLRAHGTERDPATLWQTYEQLSEAEAAFRTLKSEVKVRPIWHWTAKRVEAHVLVAFWGYCLWVCLKKKAQRSAPRLTPWQILDQLGRVALVEVGFELRDGRRLCLPRLTQPEPAQAVLPAQRNWTLPPHPRRACRPKTCRRAGRNPADLRRPPDGVCPTGAPRATHVPENQSPRCRTCERRGNPTSATQAVF